MSKSAFRRSMDGSDRGWLIWFGVGITIIWVLGGFGYVFFVGIDQLLSQGAEVIGGFLEGFFAPLAFLWLVIGLFIQQYQLAQNTAVLQETQATTAQQTKVLEATELRARQSTFFQIAENVRRQTGNLAGIIVGSQQDAEGHPLLSKEEMQEHWIDHQRGQYEKFPAIMLNPADEWLGMGNDEFESLFGTEERTATSTEYVKSFRELLRLAQESDPQGTLVRTTTQTPHGMLYEIMLENIPAEASAILCDDQLSIDLSAQESVAGNWRMVGQSVFGINEWFLTFSETQNGLVGSNEPGDGQLELTDLKITGNLLFGRLKMQQTKMVITALVSDKEMKGTIDYREGVFGTFTGLRQG